MLPNIIEILSKMTPKSIQKGSKIAPGAARRRPKSLQGVPPRRFREPGRKKDPPPRETGMQLGPKMAPQIATLVDFGVIFDVF